VIPRTRYSQRLVQALAANPIVALLGPRQVGKTTLARSVAEDRASDFYDLEHPTDRARLSAPSIALADRAELIVLDEIQRMPELFELLRVLADRSAGNGRFLVLGSASPRIVKGISESLAGRVSFVDLSGFDSAEVGPAAVRDLWARGGFPRSYLAADDGASLRWRNDFVRTFLERDVAQLGISIPAETLRRFWTMLAHFHGQVLNLAELARSLGAAEGTARRYLDILSGAFMVRQLQPWHANLKKRQVKAPKVYIRDSGLLHALLAIGDLDALQGHPKLGASWEGFVIEEIIARSQSRDVYYWATHAGAELDLLLLRDGQALGFEVKYTDAPRTTRSMRSALADLDLHHLYVVHPGAHSFPLDERISATTVADLPLD
jgi:predicted AAA+ superfamily ATPase